MKIVFFPFFKAQVPVIYALLGEYPELAEKFEIYGITSNMQYNSTKSPAYLINRNYELKVKLIGKEELGNISKQDFVVQVSESFSYEQGKFVTAINDELKKNGIVVHRSIEKLMQDAEICNKRVKAEAFSNYRHQLQKIHTPIIGVGAMVSLQDTAEVMIKLKQNLKTDMCVSTIYAHPELAGCNLNCISVNDMSGMSFEEKIFYINWYVNEVIENEKPDIILIEIPGGLAKLHNKCLNGGGEYPFLYRQAIPINYLVCSLPANNIRDFEFGGTSNYLQRKYGFTKVFYHVSNMMILFDKEIDKDDVPCIYLDEEYIVGEIATIRKKDREIPVYNLLEDEEIRKWCEVV